MWEHRLASSIVMIAFVVVMALVYYFFNYQHLKRQKQHFTELHQKLESGQNVIALNGLYGTLIRVGDETVDLKTKSGTVMEISRFAITEIIH